MAARTERARLRAALKSRELTGAEVLAGADEHPLWAGVKVSWLLEALPGVGCIRSDKIMKTLRIAPSRRIQGLGIRQRAALIAELRREGR
jgi:predicted kinase